MPKHSSAKNDQNAVGRKGVKRPRIAANGHRLPDPIPRGEILTDVLKRKWKIGKSIGLGGFGEIYLASDDIRKQPGLDAKYVIKVEPHSNGPLFAEMHFYYRVCKSDQKRHPVRSLSPRPHGTCDELRWKSSHLTVALPTLCVQDAVARGSDKQF